MLGASEQLGFEILNLALGPLAQLAESCAVGLLRVPDRLAQGLGAGNRGGALSDGGVALRNRRVALARHGVGACFRALPVLLDCRPVRVERLNGGRRRRRALAGRVELRERRAAFRFRRVAPGLRGVSLRDERVALRLRSSEFGDEHVDLRLRRSEFGGEHVALRLRGSEFGDECVALRLRGSEFGDERVAFRLRGIAFGDERVAFVRECLVARLDVSQRLLDGAQRLLEGRALCLNGLRGCRRRRRIHGARLRAGPPRRRARR